MWAGLCIGCAGSAIDPGLRNDDGRPRLAALPGDYRQRNVADVAAVTDDWLSGWLDDFAALFPSAGLAEHVRLALARDHVLAQQRHRTAEAERFANIARSERLPALSLRIDASRAAAGQSVPTTERWRGELGLDVDLDLAGRLAASERRATWQYLAQRERLRDATLTTAAETARAHISWLEARRLLALFEARLDNLTTARAIIASGYRLGINEALDLYLADSTLAQERANVAAQRQSVQEATARLQLRLVDYPSGEPSAELAGTDATASALPLVDEPPALGVPSELLTRRADLGAAWYELLAADAGLAVAHRARFPRLLLTGGLGQSGTDAADLTDAPTIRTVAGSLVQPLFAFGQLAALEDVERERVRATERHFLELTQLAFAEVETALAALANDRAQYAAIVVAERSASAAAELAFAQYRRGLVNYATVLEAQRRAFDAQSSAVRLRARLLLDRIAVHDALGGRIDLTTSNAT